MATNGKKIKPQVQKKLQSVEDLGPGKTAAEKKMITAHQEKDSSAIIRSQEESACFQEVDPDSGSLPTAEGARRKMNPLFETTQAVLQSEELDLIRQEADVRQLSLHCFAFDEADDRGWLPLHEAAVQLNQAVLAATLQASQPRAREWKTLKGETPLFLAVELSLIDNVQFLLLNGCNPNSKNEEGNSILIAGADVLSQASDGVSVLFEAATVENTESLALLLEYGADANVPKYSGHLPIHRATYKGYCQLVKQLIPVTDYSAIKESGISPVHSAAAAGQQECLKLLLQSKFDVNFMLSHRLRRSYNDNRKSALYFAVSNNDVCSARLLLEAGALPNQDPINCLQLALRLANYELISLLLRHGANVNYYCRVNTTHFPSALQYALNDEVILRMLFSYGYDINRCFDCPHENKIHPLFSSEGWTSTVIKDNMFCEVITLNWLKHLTGKVVRVMMDYVAHVHFCSKLKSVLEQQNEWLEITYIMQNPRSLKHLCRLMIRQCMGRMRLRCPVFMTFLSLPRQLKEYILFKEYDLYDGPKN
ncbi:dynein axonemal heavy chain 12-like isoform X4 [Narcine bancroftii]|uniref:dynein axonemal heavy chain 12-like isoform X4 n=1 Tax=Narcine bancroftii TaxID=1343680 RepID=UPI003831744D